MPSAEARAAFNEAQRIAAQLRDKQAEEKGLATILGRIDDARDIAAMEKELVRVRHEWLELSRDYTDAVTRFSRAADAARRKLPRA